MAYIKDRRNNPIRRNGSFVLASNKFSAVVKDQWGYNMPPRDLLTQDDVNNYLASTINGYDLLTLNKPTVTSIYPSFVELGEYTNQLVIYGSNFRSATSVTVGGVAYPFSTDYYGNVIYIYSQNFSAAGPIVATTSNGASNADVTVRSATAITIDSISPALGTFGDTITVTGSGFLSAEYLYVGNTQTYFNAISDNEMTFIPSDYTEAGSNALRITRADKTFYSPNDVRFTLLFPPMSITSLSTTAVTPYDYIYVYGTGFQNRGLSVTVGGQPVGYSYAGSSNLIYVYLGDNGASGQMVISNSYTGQASVTSNETITLTPQLRISDVTPTYGYRSNQTTFTLYGSNFSTVTAVYLYNVNTGAVQYQNDFTINSNNQLTFRTDPATSNGYEQVFVVSPDNTIGYYGFNIYLY